MHQFRYCQMYMRIIEFMKNLPYSSYLSWIIGLIFLLFSTRANSNPELDLSLKSGPNAATLEHDNRENRYGVTGGIAGDLRWPVLDRMSLGGQIESLYTPRGANAVFGGVADGGSRGHYLDLVVGVAPGGE